MDTFTWKREREEERGENTERKDYLLSVVFLWPMDHFSELLSMLCSYVLTKGYSHFPPFPNLMNSKGFLVYQDAILVTVASFLCPMWFP